MVNNLVEENIDFPSCNHVKKIKFEENNNVWFSHEDKKDPLIDPK